MLVFLKLLFPSWRFFDDYSQKNLVEYQFYVKNSNALDINSQWTELWPQKRQFKLFLNTNANLYHAFHNLIDQTILELTHTIPESSFTLKLLHRAVEWELKNKFQKHSTFYFQWRIMNYQFADNNSQIIYLSPEQEVCT